MPYDGLEDRRYQASIEIVRGCFQNLHRPAVHTPWNGKDHHRHVPYATPNLIERGSNASFSDLIESRQRDDDAIGVRTRFS